MSGLLPLFFYFAIMSAMTGYIAFVKKRDPAVWAVIGFFGGFVAMIVLVAMPNGKR
jgi:hypothetical protein